MAGRVALGPSSLPENALTSSRLESGRLRRKRAIDESCQDRSRVEIVAGEREGRCGMPLRFRGHPRDRLRRLDDGAECQHAEPSRNMPYESRILDDGGDAEGQIACGPARKPTRASRDVRVLRHAPLSERARQIRSIGPRVARHCVRVDDAPAVPLEAFDRAGTAEGDLERQSAAGGERDETLEFVPLAAIGDTTDHGPMVVLLPRRDGRQRTPSRTDGHRVTREAVQHDGLAGGDPGDVLWNATLGSSEVLAEGEEHVVPPQGPAMPARPLVGSTPAAVRVERLREHRVTVDEDQAWSSDVLVTEAAGERDVDEEVRTRTEGHHIRPAAPVQRARRVAEGPVLRECRIDGLEPCREERGIGVTALDERSRARIVAPLLRVLEIENVVSQPGEAEKVLDVVP